MITRKMLAAAVATAGLLGAFAAQADDSKRTAGEYTDDKMLVGKVKSALISDDTADAGEINVESYKGVIQLNGFVDNAKEKAQAEAVAKAVAGVKGVENNLMIKDASQTAGGAIDDSTITAKVKSALIDDEATKGGDIKVETRGGVVQLSGFVSSQSQKDAAAKVAKSVSGVKSVNNGLGVKK
jgi:hyperosmotically inducible periplasmic protein